MNKTKSTFLALIAILLSPMAANADLITLDFEGDVGDVSGFVTEHLGFTFSGDRGDFSWVHSTSFNDIVPTSGDYLAWSNGGARLDFLGGVLFSLESAWLSGRNGICSGDTIQQTVRGFNGATEVATQEITLGCTGQLSLFNFSASFSNIDRIQFDDERVNLVLDDISIITSVPEPGTLALFGIGLLGMGAARRRKKA